MLTIRPAQSQDAATILRFVTELAVYEEAGHQVMASVADIERTIFGASSTTHALMAEHEGVAVGFAVYFYNYSTWQGKSGLYLEDLYVTPASRGMGAGKALLKALAEIARERGCGRFEWSVLDWNQPAIDFYESLGAAPQKEWVRYRLVESQFDALINA
ncbi:GNAT family N-acetyltransferase [Chitinibacteraceae bacterium HSL-7]